MSATRNQTAEVAVLFSAEERDTELREEVRLGLTSTPKELQPKWFYDERGSELFDAITRLPEYYLTRAERSILERHAGEIAALTDAATLIELGSGTSDKTRLLLDVVAPRRFVPFDVSEETLRAEGASCRMFRSRARSPLRRPSARRSRRHATRGSSALRASSSTREAG